MCPLRIDGVLNLLNEHGGNVRRDISSELQHKYVLYGNVNTFPLFGLKISRQRDLIFFSMLWVLLHSIDPSCVVSPAFEEPPDVFI